MAAVNTDAQISELEIAFAGLIAATGEDPNREGLTDTPRRAARGWGELLEGYTQDPQDFIKTFEHSSADQMIVVSGIKVVSLCEHHLLPFFGTASVGYIPNGKVIGVSKIARIVNCLSRRLQIQERLTQEVLTTIAEGLEPLGAMVVIKAEHLCMKNRGVREPNSVMTTSACCGMFRENPATRAEFLAIAG